MKVKPLTLVLVGGLAVVAYFLYTKSKQQTDSNSLPLTSGAGSQHATAGDVVNSVSNMFTSVFNGIQKLSSTSPKTS